MLEAQTKENASFAAEIESLSSGTRFNIFIIDGCLNLT